MWKNDVQFYQYNRTEILNPGGLYGKANPSNFPRVNDYRNLRKKNRNFRFSIRQQQKKAANLKTCSLYI